MYVSTNLVGQPQFKISAGGSASADFMVGAEVQAVDPYFGAATLLYGKANGDISRYALCVASATVGTGSASLGFIVAPNTAGTGASVVVALAALTSGEYGWFLKSGAVPVLSTANLAAAALPALSGAGTIGALANGKQILGARVVAPSTSTLAKTATGNVGSNTLHVSSSDGWFVGMAVTGTGIPASTTITEISAGQNKVMISNALTALPSTVTGTYNDGSAYFNLVHLNHAHIQGQVV